MSTLSIHINGRDYQVACDDGQEAHLNKLAQDINSRMQLITKHMGRVPENLHFVLTMLMMSDELSDARKENIRLQRAASAGEAGEMDTVALEALEEDIADQMEAFAARLESLAKKVTAA